MPPRAVSPTHVAVTIHASQFPAAIRRALLESLRSRQINPKFHYESVKQVGKWLALHQAFSPSRAEASCGRAYDLGFVAAAERLVGPRLHLVGLGCGGGRKDAALLRKLRVPGRELFYTPVDVSTAMVLEGWQSALAEIPESNCFPVVCDLAATEDLGVLLEPRRAAEAARLYTFFGMIPNFEPGTILPRLAAWVRPGDRLLFSANLAPGGDYAEGVRRILPQYDNSLTRDWLMTFLLDLGVEAADGMMRFGVETDPAANGLQRMAAYFDFTRPRSVVVEAERFAFQPGDSLRLFFSYRYTPARVRGALEPYGLQVTGEWIADSGEEGVFLVERAG